MCFKPIKNQLMIKFITFFVKIKLFIFTMLFYFLILNLVSFIKTDKNISFQIDRPNNNTLLKDKKNLNYSNFGDRNNERQHREKT